MYNSGTNRNQQNNPAQGLEGQVALQKLEDLFDRADRRVMSWPTVYKYSHGERLFRLLNDMEALCVAAHLRYFKKTTLSDLDICNHQLQLLIRRLHRTKYTDKAGKQRTLLTDGEHAEWAGFTVEIGKLIGGWIKKTEEREKTAKSSK